MEENGGRMADESREESKLKPPEEFPSAVPVPVVMVPEVPQSQPQVQVQIVNPDPVDGPFELKLDDGREFKSPNAVWNALDEPSRAAVFVAMRMLQMRGHVMRDYVWIQIMTARDVLIGVANGDPQAQMAFQQISEQVSKMMRLP